MDVDVTCTGCGARVRRKGLRAHQRSLQCERATAKASYAERGWVAVGYFSGAFDALKMLGAPIERARTGRKSGNRVTMESWTPRWALTLAEAAATKGGALDQRGVDLFKRLIVRCGTDPTTEAALRALIEGTGINHLTIPMLVTFAEAALPDVVSHDAAVKQAVEQLRDVLRRTSA